ncbi:hypothetical protein [Kangiella sediminilitoris]|uniref:Uncharacterized protein n=1 Tax=Kangiella sediminilitoris TaxID=1144748 RepID=A0A1B3B7I3_9GAMM|nr:hypothetical protein [Kangiella sediminilitoris]AOE48746.1 hypothetical protein KS2013_14 [Kangiella sediminilitoris]
MSLLEWIILIIACFFIVGFGYAGVTGKSIFSFRKKKPKHRH